MNFLHYELQLGQHDVVVVTLDKQANVQLMDSSNFDNYRRRERFSYYGGLVKQSPFRLKPPHGGNWHLAIDLGGYAGSVSASVNVERH
jgi:hypothetical protein